MVTADIMLKYFVLVFSSGLGKPDTITTKHILKQHQLRAMSAKDDEDFQRLTVRRAYLFADALRGFSKPTFNASKPLKVSFIGEHAVDAGGPRRELFRHLIPEIATKSGLFAGWPDHVVPLHNIDAVASNTFYVVGKMLAACLVQGGQPPVCFAHAVADYLVFDRVRSVPCIQDIADYEVQQFMEQVTGSSACKLIIGNCVYKDIFVPRLYRQVF